MRVLMTLHHGMNARSGAPGATLAIARALEQHGCSVKILSYDDQFGSAKESLARHILFPIVTARALARIADGFDVIDASSGDAFLWAMLPRSKRAPALVTRSHGLEHTVDASLRARARAGDVELRKRYYLYHGGLRLWEVSRSFQLADYSIVLNEIDARCVVEKMHVPQERVSVVTLAADDRLFETEIEPSRGPIRLAFIGSWIERKGTATIAAAMDRLVAANIPTELLLIGTAKASADVLSDFSSQSQTSVHVIPSFDHARLGELLHDSHVLLSTSHAEGFQLGLVEGMACGLAPIATPVGYASSLIVDEENGMFIDVGDAPGLSEKVARIERDRNALDRMRRNARARVSQFRWNDVARQTVDVYRTAIRNRRSVR